MNPTFRNFAGRYQLRLETEADFEYIQQLDEARWAATSAPISAFQCDPNFLKLIAYAQDGRIRTTDLKAAQRWLFKVLKDRSGLLAANDKLQLRALDTSHSEGQEIKAAAEFALNLLHPPSLEQIDLEQIKTFRKTYSQTLPNGDGVVTPESLENAEAKALANTILQLVGKADDVSGKPGIAQSQLETFCKQAEATIAWIEQGQLDPDGQPTAVHPWHAATAEAAALVKALDEKIELYFRQCELVKLDRRAESYLKLKEDELKTLDISSAAAIEVLLDRAPLSALNDRERLPLDAEINPRYDRRFLELRDKVLQRIFGSEKTELTRSEWRSVKAVFANYWKWLEAKPAGTLDTLGLERLKALLAGPGVTEIRSAIVWDLSVAKNIQQVDNLEKLVLFQRWFKTFANNFVSFSTLYNPHLRALFMMGKLIFDGRAFTFTVRVDDRNTHKKFAAYSKTFVIYAELTTGTCNEKIEIAAAVTRGDRSGLYLGKRGLFLDVNGKAWDATIVDLLENPISLWEAIKAPFIRVGDLIKSKVESLASSKTGALEEAASKGLDATAAPPPPDPKANSNNMRDLLVGGGIAFAAIGSSFVYLVKTIADLNPLKVLLALCCLIGLVIGCSALLAWLKLRRRDMSALLEASGWAVNLRMYITRPLGKLFTRRPALPKGALRESADLAESHQDQLEEEKEGSWWNVFWVLVVLILFAWLYLTQYPETTEWLMDKLRSIVDFFKKLFSGTMW